MPKSLKRAILSCAGCTLMLFVTCGLAFNVFSAAQPYILTQNGFTNTQTSLITTVRSAAYLLGTFAIGRYYRRLGYRAGCALCVLAPLKRAALMLASSVFLGFGASLNTVGVSIWAGDLSTPDRYEKTLRLFQGAYGLGGIVLSFLPGAIADLAGGYAAAYAVFTVMLLPLCAAKHLPSGKTLTGNPARFPKPKPGEPCLRLPGFSFARPLTRRARPADRCCPAGGVLRPCGICAGGKSELPDANNHARPH